MMEFSFKFNIDQFVLNPFGNKCIIDMCAIDNTKKECYYVKGEHKSEWFKVDQLSELPDE